MATGDLLRDVLDLVLGHTCVGCGQVEGILCPACSTLLAGPCHLLSVKQTLSENRTPSASRSLRPVVAANAYDGIARTTVIAWKEHGLRPLTAALGDRLAHAVISAMQVIEPDRRTALALVPVPAHRQRSFDHARAAALRACSSLREAGVDAVVAPALEARRAYPPMKSLGRHARATAVRGAFGVRAPRGRLPSLLAGRVLLVADDVITTGATTGEALRTLEAAGLTPCGAVGIAATQRGPQPSESGFA